MSTDHDPFSCHLSHMIRWSDRGSVVCNSFTPSRSTLERACSWSLSLCTKVHSCLVDKSSSGSCFAHTFGDCKRQVFSSHSFLCLAFNYPRQFNVRLHNGPSSTVNGPPLPRCFHRRQFCPHPDVFLPSSMWSSLCSCSWHGTFNSFFKRCPCFLIIWQKNVFCMLRTLIPLNSINC